MKILIITLLSAVCFVAQPGAANADSIVSSKHDFTALGTSPCGVCHTVHSGLGGRGLMNPGFGAFPLITKVYSSSTKIYNADIATLNKSDAPLCLACHDQTTVNSNGNLTVVQQKFTTRADPGVYINTDLSNDHPVGFDFDPTLSPTKIKAPVTAHVTFGPSRKQMWCSTCHNVHNNQFGNFLVMSNSGSALCLDCHKV